MAGGILSIITTAQLANPIEAIYLKDFLEEVDAIDFRIYDQYSKKISLPKGQYGDTSVTGDLGANHLSVVPGTAVLQNVNGGSLDGWVATGWDDQGYLMNYGETIDGVNTYTGDIVTDNFLNFAVPEGTAYGNNGSGAQNYRAHDKEIANKFNVNIPIQRFIATTQYDNLASVLIASDDSRMLVQNFGRIAQVIVGQYMRATLINGATQVAPGTTLTDYGTAAELATLEETFESILANLKLKAAKKQRPKVNASDKVTTSGQKEGYIAIVSSQMERAMKKLSTFVPAIEYASDVALPNELGSILGGEIRLVTNDMLVRQSGTAGTNTLGIADDWDTTNARLNTYNMIIFGKNAFAKASLSGKDEYKLYIDEPGKGNDTARVEKNMAWKAIVGAAVLRPAHIINVPIGFTYA